MFAIFRDHSKYYVEERVRLKCSLNACSYVFTVVVGCDITLESRHITSVTSCCRVGSVASIFYLFVAHVMWGLRHYQFWLVSILVVLRCCVCWVLWQRLCVILISSANFQHFVERKCSLQSTKAATNGFFSNPHESNPYAHFLLSSCLFNSLKDRVVTLLTADCWSSWSRLWCVTSNLSFIWGHSKQVNALWVKHFWLLSDKQSDNISPLFCKKRTIDSDLLRAGRAGDRIPVRSRFPAPVETGPGAHPASYTMGIGSVSGLKRLGRDVNRPPLSSAEVKERVELYPCSPSGPLWPVLGRTLPFLSFWLFIKQGVGPFYRTGTIQTHTNLHTYSYHYFLNGWNKPLIFCTTFQINLLLLWIVNSKRV